MGLFDWIKCEVPLPGNPPEWALHGHAFQTKDLPCLMDIYTITADGRLEGGDRDFSTYTGTIQFYDSNIVASGPGTYTRDGEDAISLEYRATFIRGRLVDLAQVEFTREPAAKFNPEPHRLPKPEEREARKRRRAEALTGRTLCVWYGGESSEPYDAVVRLENARQLVVERCDDGRFEVLDRDSRDVTFFDSLEDGKRSREERQADWDRRKAEFEAVIAAKASPQQEEPHSPAGDAAANTKGKA
jgi:hypothetical protein